jgi:hypothetical protein
MSSGASLIRLGLAPYPSFPDGRRPAYVAPNPETGFDLWTLLLEVLVQIQGRSDYWPPQFD